jgi:hypothetical protein
MFDTSARIARICSPVRNPGAYRTSVPARS